MRRYLLRILIVLAAVSLVVTACVVRTRPGYRHHNVKQKHAKHQKHEPQKKHKKHKNR